MKKILSILAYTFLITGIMSSNVFAASINDIPDKNVSQSEMFYSNANYNLNVDIQNTTTDSFVNGGASIYQSDTGYIKAQGLTESYMNVYTIGYTLYVEKYVNGYWIIIKTFSYSLNNINRATANHSLPVASYSYYRVRCTNHIINNGVKTSKSSISNSIYIN
ncbi:hypothetical protein [Clostridium sp.]|jgi:hypothetical protein|uniref:hypothetical protein n=1 Tax=Clostridium sp. TaxID=1506 RepID=UPI003EED37C6